MEEEVEYLSLYDYLGKAAGGKLVFYLLDTIYTKQLNK